ncbi:DNA alkylation repair protein [Hanstruepera neustonica]|uniref:DNA alkylation repair protein n=1 Tax=Hanstruepera neustonica TaxID=1445657 RepID=A0A2K1DX80_9FLAO|nr:DNA alkylation repair protein [Hanstruepera neustonica]PNQ72609.1 DNA alkylation repair protein [Hanstruepera neustonica]
MGFIKDIQESFQMHANRTFSVQMSAYMLNQFKFYGIKAPFRRELTKPLFDKYNLEIRDTFRSLVFDLYDLPYRELHMVAIEIFEKQFKKSYEKKDIHLIENLITINSWWDSVDFIAKNILGKYLQIYLEEIPEIISRFSEAENLWLNRSTIIFQLGYKEKTDEQLLFKQCLIHKNSKEFFIQKAIGWALREYGKTNPDAVLNFVETNTLKPLSKREAIRNLI